MEFFTFQPQAGEFFREYQLEPGRLTQLHDGISTSATGSRKLTSGSREPASSPREPTSGSKEPIKLFNCYMHRMLGYRYNWHHQYEFEMVMKGRMKTGADGRVQLFQAGDFFLINPLVGHASLKQEPDTMVLTLHFPMDAFSRFIPAGTACRFNFSTSDATRELPGAAMIRHLAVTMMQTAMSGNTELLLALYDSFICTLFTILSPQIVHESAVEITSEQEEKISEMITYIREHFREKITLEDVAELLGYNRTYISTFFKKNCGISFYEYLTMVRLSESIYGLCDNSISLTQIALDSGFPDLKTFNRLFRENFGELPADYRSEYQDTISPQRGICFLRADDKASAELLERYRIRM